MEFFFPLKKSCGVLIFVYLKGKSLEMNDDKIEM